MQRIPAIALPLQSPPLVCQVAEPGSWRFPLLMLRRVSLILLAMFFVVAGTNHFLNPRAYLAMIPPYLPVPGAMNLISGAAEILGGFAVLVPRLRRAAGWGLIALLIAVFPANIHVALHSWDGVTIPAWVLWARLPLQIALVAWVYFSCLSPAR